MNILTLIVVNAVLCAAVVYGIVLLLAHGIRTDKPVVREGRALPFPSRSEHRRAA